MSHQFGPRTRLIHGNPGFDHGEFRSHAFPIFQTSTFRFDSVEEGEEIFSGTAMCDAYSRISNPDFRFLETHLRVMEEGESAQVFDSGMSAIKTTLEGFVNSGDHIVAHRNLYGGTYKLLKKFERKWNVNTTFVDARYIPNVISAITKNTKAVFLESPSNPVLDVCDFEEISAMVHFVNPDIVVIVDGTFATPYNQKPLTHGVDVVVHSLTKYLDGSGFFIGGAVVTSKKLMEKIWETHDGSGMMAPLIAVLLAHNTVSTEDRVKRHNENAEKIVHHFYMHKEDLFHKIYYPGLRNHPNHDVAKKLMTGFGGIISFELKDDENGSRTRSFLNKLSMDYRTGEGIIPQMVSLGTVDTLICCPALSTHRKVPREERLAQGITDNLIRLSVGTEDVEDIIYSLERGFQAISST